MTFFYPGRKEFDFFMFWALEHDWYDSKCFSPKLVFGDQSAPCPIIGFTKNTFTLRVCGGNPEKCRKYKDYLKKIND